MRASTFTNRIHPIDPQALTFALVVTTALLLSTYVVYATGGTHRAFPHLFYIPIIMAASFFRIPGALLTGILAGLLCGPMMPLDVDAGTMQSTSNWLVRGAFFIAIGTVAGVGFQVMYCLERDKRRTLGNITPQAKACFLSR